MTRKYSQDALYRNVHFRSTLEAFVAAFLDSHRIAWEYEPLPKFVLNATVSYWPDFWLPEIGTWIECKPYDVDNIKSEIDDDDLEKLELFSVLLEDRGKGESLVLVRGGATPLMLDRQHRQIRYRDGGGRTVPLSWILDTERHASTGYVSDRQNRFERSQMSAERFEQMQRHRAFMRSLLPFQSMPDPAWPYRAVLRRCGSCSAAQFGNIVGADTWWCKKCGGCRREHQVDEYLPFIGSNGRMLPDPTHSAYWNMHNWLDGRVAVATPADRDWVRLYIGPIQGLNGQLLKHLHASKLRERFQAFLSQIDASPMGSSATIQPSVGMAEDTLRQLDAMTERLSDK